MTRLVSLAYLGGAFALACGIAGTHVAAQDSRPSNAPAPAAAPSAPPLSTVTDAMLNNPSANDWLTWRRTTDSWGFSPLKQITPANVKSLHLVWAHGLNGPGKQEGTPLEHDGVLFMPEPNDVIRAYNAVTGDAIWEYRRSIPDDIRNYIPHPDTKRNIAMWGDFIITLTNDDYVVALDAKTGKLAWQTQVTDYKVHPVQMSSGPIIADGKVIATHGCEPKAGPEACFLSAYDAATGKELWKFYTLPRPGEPGSDTWGDIPYEGRWHTGAWMPASYDPDLKMVFVGTSVTSPAPKFALGGNTNEYWYNNNTLAIDAETGKLVWHYQHVVDHWDLDHPFERVILDTAVAPDPKTVKWINPNVKAGERRKVITGIPGKTGIIYTLDAKTGEFLWATPTIPQTVVKDIDATGKVTVNPDAMFDRMGQERLICPNPNGGRNWPSGSYSPLTGLLYIPEQYSCGQMVAIVDKPTLQSLYGTRYKAVLPEGETNVGSIWAFSPATGKPAWVYRQRSGTLSVVATGGGLLFGGDANGRFRALDQKTGKVLWETNLGAPVTGYPISYAVNGKQYVVASTGTSLSTGGWDLLTPEVKMGSSNMIFVFALD